MTNADLFRLILIVIFAAFLPFALYHRIRSNTGEKLDRWQEGPLILFGLRFGAVPWFVGSLVWMINPQWMAWSSVPLPIWLRWCGFVLIGLWGVLLVWTFRSLGKSLTDTVVTRQDHTLVTTGPYRYVRHPFYLAFIVAVIGGSLVAANWFVFVTGLVPFGFIIARTRIEEAKLIERFGEEYREYMARVGRFIPRLR
jgi:protein-S-isoprenylcysteine O-methyltransferase Ste14